jgi:hypothetical protein
MSKRNPDAVTFTILWLARILGVAIGWYLASLMFGQHK